MNSKILMTVMLILIIGALLFAGQGIMMHNQVSIEEQKFHTLQDQYFSLSKSTRDAAETDSSLNKDLVEINNFPSELLRLKLVGVGKILSGIFILLFAILLALMSMPARLAKIIKK